MVVDQLLLLASIMTSVIWINTMIKHDIKEGRHYVVYSRNNTNITSITVDNWADAEQLVVDDPQAFKILSVEVYDIPLMGIRERHKRD